MIDSPALAAGLRIGILGGSFNPAHDGHIEITDAARRACRLDRVWWLVSPQNPLKSPGEYLPFNERINRAGELAAGRPWLRISDYEARIGTRYTADTLAQVVRRFPSTKFAWIMGADSLASFHRWKNWRDIAAMMPLCVISRPGYDLAALKSVAALALRGAQVQPRNAASLVSIARPGWVFLPTAHNLASATALRQLR